MKPMRLMNDAELRAIEEQLLAYNEFTTIRDGVRNIFPEVFIINVDDDQGRMKITLRNRRNEVVTPTIYHYLNTEHATKGIVSYDIPNNAIELRNGNVIAMDKYVESWAFLALHEIVKHYVVSSHVWDFRCSPIKPIMYVEE